MAVIERIRRRPLEVRFVEYTTTAFAVLLISFMAYVTMYDIKRLPLFHMMFNRDSQIEQPETPASPPSDVGTQQERLEIQPAKKPASPPSTAPSAP
jgi:hypothetical protein